MSTKNTNPAKRKSPAKPKKDRRPGATWINMGSDGHMEIRLDAIVTEADNMPMRQLLDDLYARVYKDVPGPPFGTFVQRMIEPSALNLNKWLKGQGR